MLDQIQLFLSRHDEEEVGGLIAGLAARAEITPAAVEGWLYSGRAPQGVAFDIADRLMLYMIGPQAWRGEFDEYYQGVNLNWKSCGCPGCEVMIELPKGSASHGPTMKLYCSDACRTAAAKMRAGVTSARRKNYNYTTTKCRNGHPRTPENTKHRANGSYECRVCARENAKRLWHEKYSPVAKRAAAA